MALPISYNVRNLFVRWQVTLLAVVGISLVVTVFVILLSMASGFRIALRSTGTEQNAVITQRESNSELTSAMIRDHVNRIAVDGRIARGSDGQPLASPEMVVVANMPRKADGEATNVTVRGVTPRAFEVRGGIEITQGRKFQPGLYEVMVGERIQERMRGLETGSKVKIQRRLWDVVGAFKSAGGAFESEIWGDAEVMAPAFQRTGIFQSLTVRLKDPSTVTAFDKELQANPQMQVQAVQERKYYEDQAGPVAASLLGLAGFVAIVMGTGAVFGALNTMYTLVSARTREIGTLRALGFSRAAILFSFVMESVLLALVGGIVGCLLALPANGLTTGTSSNFSELAFAFQMTPTILGAGLAFAGTMGLMGGLLPAFQAAKLPIAESLRAD